MSYGQFMTNYLCSILKTDKDTAMKKQTMKIRSSQIKTRVTWGFNPVARVKPSKNIYSRKKYKRIVLDKI